jgi:hypothetical protein
MTKKKSAKSPTRSDSEYSANCPSNARTSNAGTSNFAPLSSTTSMLTSARPQNLGLGSWATFLSLVCTTASAHETNFVLWWGPTLAKLENQLINDHAWSPNNLHLSNGSKVQHHFPTNAWRSLIDCSLNGSFAFAGLFNSDGCLHFLQDQVPLNLEDIFLQARIHSWWEYYGTSLTSVHKALKMILRELRNCGNPHAWHCFIRRTCKHEMNSYRSPWTSFFSYETIMKYMANKKAVLNWAGLYLENARRYYDQQGASVNTLCNALRYM